MLIEVLLVGSHVVLLALVGDSIRKLRVQITNGALVLLMGERECPLTIFVAVCEALQRRVLLDDLLEMLLQGNVFYSD